MSSRAPLGLIGGLGGALGALPLLSAARRLAERLASAPELPGAERLAGDLKAASYAEAAVLLAVLPLAALFFGALLPRWLEARAPAGGPSLEWVAGGFALALPIWRCGATARGALLVGALLALLAAVLLLFWRRRPSLGRRTCALRGEPFGPVLLAAGAWELARRASTGQATPGLATTLCLAALLAGFLFLLLRRARGERSRA